MYRYLKCDRGRRENNSKDPETAKWPNTKSKACGCRFVIKCEQQRVEEDNWVIELLNDRGTHNQELIVYPEGHRGVSGLSQGAKEVIREMNDAQAKPKHIMVSIKNKYPEEHPNMRHNYNFKDKIRREGSEGRNVVEQMLHLAREHGYINWVSCNDRSNKVITRLFLAHPAMVENFMIAYAFMKDETSTSYRWVLEKLKLLLGEGVTPTAILTDKEGSLMRPVAEVFPRSRHLLCTWHINNDVEAHVALLCNKNKDVGAAFKNGVWKRIMEAATEAEYESAVVVMEDRYGRWPAVIDYVHKTWLTHHRQKFVLAWTNEVLHFGNIMTCRVESQHSVVKSWLGSLQGSLDTVFRKVHASINYQVTEIKIGLEISRRRHGVLFKHYLYQQLIGRVFHHALELILDERTRMLHLSTEVFERCGCAMLTTHGLPCACRIFTVLQGGVGIYIDLVHRFWRTLEIGEGDNIPEIVADSAQVTEQFRSLVDDVLARAIVVIRDISRIVHDELHPEHAGYEEPELIPDFMLQYIRGYTDVIPDGNCGFRCVAEFFLGDHERYGEIRSTVVGEIKKLPQQYTRVYLPETISNTLYRIDWRGGRYGEEHWMVSDPDLWPIATHFNAVVIIFSIGGVSSLIPNMTILPLENRYAATRPSKEIVMIFLMSLIKMPTLDMSPDFPLPSIPHYWRGLADYDVRDWESRYHTRIEAWTRYANEFNFRMGRS
ncbi:uncharacterized protein [Spinacia oleracea]|uniref:MULE transposase domain-containing protein n=1 Tax=Spinacia oleracea TaxID=3562 RepID=A0ABM3RQF4_SPIOL|nr:uncharacterized protein LOC110793865 [Spinacia oleracea]